MTKVTDEMLMAFADGELDEDSAAAIARAVENDPAQGRRLESLAQTRKLAKAAFAGVTDEPVPDRLLAAAEGRSPGKRLPARSWMRRLLLPAGAAVAAGVGFVVAAATLREPAVTLTPMALAPELATILESVPSGEGRSLANGVGVVPKASYVAPGAVCRTFDLKFDRHGGILWHEVACRHDGVWEVQLAVADHGRGADATTFAPASDGASQSIDTFLEAIGAGESLDETTERALREHGWQMKG